MGNHLPRRPTLGILLRLTLLRQVALAITHHFAHVLQVLLVVSVRVLVRVALEDGDYLASTVVADRLAVAVFLAPAGGCGGGLLEPGAQFRGAHVDDLVEFSGVG